MVTDGFKSYNPALRIAFKKNPVHHVRAGIKHSSHDEGYTVATMERLQGTLRERVKVQRGWKSMNTALSDGMLIQYNYINPHGALSGMTPSDAVEIELPGTDRWKTLIERGQKFKKQKEKEKKQNNTKDTVSERASDSSQ